MDDKILKGEGFVNRYRITGQIKTLSPLHIGTGEETDAVYSEQERTNLKKRLDKVPLVSTVIKDGRGKPLIPGSALKGVMRHWLWNILVGISPDWAIKDDKKYNDLLNLSQTEQIKAVKKEFGWLEILFGTPFHEGKIEVWDATCSSSSLPAPDKLLKWNSESLTYIDTSVAIDPATGTALEHLLYKTEVVPPGVMFDFNLTAQNLTEPELGLILLALQGFNSAIYPIHLGARTGRGYGRVRFLPGPIYGLEKNEVKTWIQNTIDSFSLDQGGDAPEPKFKGQEAGHYALPKLSQSKQVQLIASVKAKLKTLLSEPVKSEPDGSPTESSGSHV